MFHHKHSTGQEQFRDLRMKIEKDRHPPLPVGRVSENHGEKTFPFRKQNECSPNIHIENSRSRFASQAFPETSTSVSEHLHGHNGTSSTPPCLKSNLPRASEEIKKTSCRDVVSENVEQRL
jgi:hypothetical protein